MAAGEVTMRDVARRAGVSLMTVSNVINGRFGAMNAATRQRIEDAIDSLGYRPRANARGLRLERNFTVGMLIVDPSSSFLADPFISQVVAGVSNHVGALGYGCLVHGVSPEEFDASIVLKIARTDGLCVFLSGVEEQRERMLRRLLSLNEPLVAIGDRLGLGHGDFAVVRQDDKGAGERLARDLVGRGASAIAFMSPSTVWPAMQARLDGVRRAVEAALGTDALEIILCGSGTVREGEEALRRRLAAKGPPPGLIAGTDRLGIAAMNVLGKHDDLCGVMLGAFHGVDYLRSADSRVTSAFVPAYDVGLRGAELLIGRIENGHFATLELVLPSTVAAGKGRSDGGY